MNKALATLIAAAASTALAAQTPEPQAPDTRTKASGYANQVVCRSVEQIGSRLGRRRICRTRAEWTELQEQERQVVDRVQSFKPCPPVC